jgi:hypothetical protein
MKNLTGMTFGKLVVLIYQKTRGTPGVWLCQCDCGTQKSIRPSSLNSGASRSCGCEQASGMRTHGKSNTRTFASWKQMRARCCNPNYKAFADYGGRGITICERWLNSFENFLADMGERPAGMSIDRYPNNDGNYELSNCRWATQAQQQRNKSNNVLLTFQGETMCITDWAEKLGISKHSLRNRICRGWSADRALTTPARVVAEVSGREG